MSTTAARPVVAATASAKKVARHKAAASNKEDPRHTWNQQLMEACIACDLPQVRELVERGADPVNAREVPPPLFYAGSLGKALQEEHQQLQKGRLTEEDGGGGSVDGGGAHDEACRGYGNTSAGDDDGRGKLGAAADGAGANHATATLGNTTNTTAAATADRLSPLAAMLLSGLDTPVARNVIAFLLQCGASVNDTFTYMEGPDEMKTGDDAAAAAAGAAAGGDAAAGGRATAAEMKKGVKKKASMAASFLNAAALATPTTAAAAASAPGEGGGSSDEPQGAHVREDRSATGSILHYVVSHGDHGHLLRLLLLAGPTTAEARAVTQKNEAGHDSSSTQPLPALPYSLLSAVEQETVVGALRHQQLASSPQSVQPTPGGKAACVSAEDSAAATTAGSGGATAQQRGCGKQKDGTTPVVSGPVSPSHTAASGADSVVGSSALTISSASAESILAAYHQQQHPHAAAPAAGGVGSHPNSPGAVLPRRRLLPLLMSAYPHLTDGAAVSTASLWNLRQLGAEVPQQSCALSHLQLDLAQVDSHGCTAAAIALNRGDTLSFRLLHFFGAPTPFSGLVNATQTRLARACSQGDVATVEALLRQGDSLAQISADGRYTLVHYAAAHPAVLQVLTDHGLSLEYENVWGESAVMSLLRHGTARNDAKYIQALHGTAAAATTGGAGNNSSNNANTSASGGAAGPAAAAPSVASPVSAAVANAVTFTQLSSTAQRNYILCPPLPLPSLTGSGGGANAASSGGGGSYGRAATAKERSASAVARRVSATLTAAHQQQQQQQQQQQAHQDQPFLGGREAGTWWSFLPPTTTTAEAIDTLLKAGAVLQGYVPDDDLELPYVRFAEAQAAPAPAAGNDGHRVSEETDYTEEMEGDECSTSTAVPTGRLTHGSSRYATRPQPCPGRLPLHLTPLQQAILDYHPELIRRLVLDYRVDPMQRDSQGATAIHYAALCTHAPSVLELLLSPQVMQLHAKPGNPSTNVVAGSSVSGSGNALAAASAAAAASAIANPNEAAISLPAAINSKVDLNCVDMAGRTPLFYAALVGNEAAVRLLLRFGALAQVGRGDRDGTTPLHVAVRQQHPGVVELLLRHTKQLLNIVTTAGGGGGGGGGLDFFTELAATAGPGSSGGGGGAGGARRTSSRGSGRRGSHRSGSLTSQGRLRRSGSDINTAFATNAPLANLLYANGGVTMVDVEAEDCITHATALELLIKQTGPATPATAAQLRMAAALLAEGQANPVRPSGLPNGGSLLHRVVADGQVELTELLLSYYADPNEVDDADETPLFLAVRQPFAAAAAEPQPQERSRKERRTSLVHLLLEYGAMPFAQSGVHLETPLHLAVRSLATPAEDSEELLQLLFYTAPDHRSANAIHGGNSNGTSAALRRGKARDKLLLSRVLDTMDAESVQMAWRGSRRGVQQDGSSGTAAGAKVSALHRRLSHSGGESGRAGRRYSSLDGNGREKRQLSSPSPSQQRRAGPQSQQTSVRRATWADDAGDMPDGVNTSTKASKEDQLSLGNSSFASVGNNTNVFGGGDDDDDDDDRSPVTSRPDSWEASTTQHAEDAPADRRTDTQMDSSGESSENAESEAGRRRAELRQWQCADHLLIPSHCWLLTNAQGETPLHVLCGSACRSLQSLPALLRLLHDVETVTLAREAASGTSGDRDVLSMLWSLPDAQGRTPLHAAAQRGFVEAMAVVLRMSPASVVAVDAQGRTPLHACVLMTRDASSSSPASPAPSVLPSTASTANFQNSGDDHRNAEEEESKEEAKEAERLHRMLQTLRDAFTGLSVNGKAVQLGGQPMHRTAKDVLPTLFRAASIEEEGGEVVRSDGAVRAVDDAAHQTRAHAIATLVQSSTITEQLQRWQQSRHWGAPALMRCCGNADSTTGNSFGAAALSSGLQSWKMYTQLTDGQGRTALLLAAELGNRRAARELLRQA